MRLWNAHRRILHKRVSAVEKRERPWRELLTQDSVKFVDDLKAIDSPAPEKWVIEQLLLDPARFFSRPKNVPLELRKQVYLPDSVITLMRTPHLAPKYASFWVPLWFNKLDFKNYLKNVYNVDVLHIRSFVKQAKVTRNERRTANGISQGNGKLYRPVSRKKMTVELVDPFVYPEEEKDLSPWESERYKREEKEQTEMAQDTSAQPRLAANSKQRQSISQQAQDLLDGKRRWKPSWQSIPADTRVLQNTTRPPGLRGTI